MFSVFGPKVPTVTSETVKKAIDTKENYVLLDVRTPEEYAKNRIAGAVNIPLDIFSETIKKKYPDKTRTYYVYCLSGSRSVQAVDIMVNQEYTKVFDMKSGLLAWRIAKLPLD